ncbi:MAG TPA: polysaccharide deacetylase family protein [Gammaproteobacteria bacterium]|nr:polysaccharide deacetylase family protein [Gammaproteobacteria bacterium]
MRHHLINFFSKLLILFFITGSSLAIADNTNTISVPILVYHVLNPTIPSSMTITPERFESQIKWLKDNGYTVIPLKQLVSYLQGKNVTLPAKPIVITADDGWKSDYTYMYPITRKYNIPITLFIYPGTISQGKNALTWDQLKELMKTGLFDIQAHTFTHPNFKQAKKHMSPDAYEKFVHRELFDSKKVLEDKLGIKIDYLAWPFGIYDSYLEQQAAKAGYTMSFSIDFRNASRIYRPMAQPRYMIVDSQNIAMFAAIVEGKAQGSIDKRALAGNQ